MREHSFALDAIYNFAMCPWFHFNNKDDFHFFAHGYYLQWKNKLRVPRIDCKKQHFPFFFSSKTVFFPILGFVIITIFHATVRTCSLKPKNQRSGMFSRLRNSRTNLLTTNGHFPRQITNLCPNCVSISATDYWLFTYRSEHSSSDKCSKEARFNTAA